MAATPYINQPIFLLAAHSPEAMAKERAVGLAGNEESVGA